MYNDDKTWEDVSGAASGGAQDAIHFLHRGQILYDEWQSFRAGRTNAAIATALGRTETEIAELDSCYSALKALYDYANNSAPSQSDYFYSLRKFS